MLGANRPLLAAIRGATGGRELATPLETWRRDLASTNQFVELWPWLLILALLLWPLDIALRRVSLGRRELADARRWVGARGRRRVAVRPQPVESMLAARDRAGASAARSAVVREAMDRESGATSQPAAAAAGPTPLASDPGPPRAAPASGSGSGSPVPEPAPGPSTPSTPASPATKPAAGPAAGPEETLTRLREAKRRARS
jgi:hypothetical protein